MVGTPASPAGLHAMSGRDSRIHAEAVALWTQLHAEPAPEGAYGVKLLDLIVGGLPEPGYERLANPHLRPFNIAFPKRA